MLTVHFLVFSPAMEPQNNHFKTQRSSAMNDGHNDVIVRSFEQRDNHVVRKIFVSSMGEMRGPFVRDVMYQAILYGLFLVLPAAFLNIVWSSRFLAFYFVALFSLLLILFTALHIGFSLYIKGCLNMDLSSIQGAYMHQELSHMWVAEVDGRVVGMVGLVPDDEHMFGKSRHAFGRLRRMAVLPKFRRLGIAKKLLYELLTYAKGVGYEHVVLLTTSAQEAALKFYPKHGFTLISEKLANRALRGFYHFVYRYDLEKLSKDI